MEHKSSWLKYFGYSFLVHIVVFIVLGFCLYSVVQKQVEDNSFEIDMTLPTEMSAGGGGGGGGVSFPKPLSEEVVQQKVAQVQQTMSQPIPTQDAVSIPQSTTTTAPSDGQATNQTGDLGTGGGSGGGNGTGSGTGNGSGVGSGDGGGSGSGSGGGDGSGVGQSQGNAPFDSEGFRQAVEANKTYPPMAIKRNLTGVSYVTATIDSAGNIIGVEASGAGSLLDAAAAKAARNVGNYPNGSGDTVTVTVPVVFELE